MPNLEITPYNLESHPLLGVAGCDRRCYIQPAARSWRGAALRLPPRGGIAKGNSEMARRRQLYEGKAKILF